MDSDISQVDADGAYDTPAVYDALAACGATVVIPPRENATLWTGSHPHTMTLANLVSLGMTAWKKEFGYYKLSFQLRYEICFIIFAALPS